MDDEINLREYLGVIKKYWLVILLITLGLTVAAFLYTLRQASLYEAKTTILFKSGGGNSLSGFASLAGLAGINLPSGGSNLGDLTELLQSKAVANRVLNDLQLRDRVKGWDKPHLSEHDLSGAVQGMLKKPKSNGNLVEVKVWAPDPKLAADVSNAYIKALSDYWNKSNYTQARKKKEYIESQFPRIEKELKNAEQKYKNFTLLIPFSPGEVNSLSSVQGIEVARLARELEIQNSVYIMLRKEYEAVKLEESKEIPPFSIIDMAVAPQKPVKPRVKLNLLIGLFLGFFSGVFVAFFLDYWHKTEKRIKN
ncbi:MAG: hypothetical protein HQ596_05685 [Candidatus Saganbacteria bacterium]|nr:hypothetical protein [Candidatus Saganbacteria bacterium]